MRRRLLAGLLGTILVASLADAAPRRKRTHFEPRIVNGVYTSMYPTTGALLDSPDFSTAGLICSGTLIGCETFLTAGHCVDGALDPSLYSVFFQHAGFFHVSSISIHPSYDFPVGDVAVLRLSTPVTGISPTPIHAGATPPVGTVGQITGFGRSGGGSDYGLKRAGAVSTSSCSGSVSNTTSVCWAFDLPIGPPGLDSNTCNGDSGGPLFADLGAGTVVAGVTSGGDSEDCQPVDHSYDANVAFYASYIPTDAAADLANTTCGSGPQVGGPDTTVLGEVGTVDVPTPEGRHSFTVPSGIGALRVAMNAIDNGSDFDLYVRAGSPPTTTEYDCRQFGSNQWAYCEFPSPEAGTWHVLVNRFAGGGTYQVTSTLFGVDCGNPANVGRPCDDGNVCTGGDVCGAGVCAGSPVSNGTPCDDDSACTTGDACQAGACTGAAVPDGTPCNDGHICTPGDSCQSGACVAGAAPAVGCRRPVTPLKGIFQLKDDPFNDARDRLTWRWASGAQTDRTEFGNPAASTAFGLCVYDETANVPQLIMERTLPVGALWTPTTAGYKYSDREASVGGIRSIVLKSGVAGRASLTVKAQGQASGIPVLPLHAQSRVTVQVIGPTSCWEAGYSAPIFNTSTQFKSRAE